MTALPVSIVVEGGPDLCDAESEQFREAFAEFGISDVTVTEADFVRYSSLGLILITLPAVPFLNAVVTKAGEDSYALVKGLLKRIRQARPENGPAEFYDATAGFRIGLREDLPEEAWRALVRLDLSVLRIGQRSLLGGYARPEVAWNALTGRWVVRPNTEEMPGLSALARPLPVTPARQSISDAALPRLPFTDDQVTAIREMVHWTDRSMVVANRAYLLYCYISGASPADIARETFTSDRLVAAVLDDIAVHGLTALDEDFTDTRAQWVGTIEQQQQILAVAQRDPREFASGHGPIATWKPSRLTGKWSLDHLAHTVIFEGITEDTSLTYLRDLLSREGLKPFPSHG